ncbi:MAG: CRISPR-associated endonuclease Cas2 [Eubacterium sp.]
MESRRKYVICYDITDNQLRYRLVKLLKGYGYRVQFSVFHCHLTADKYRELCMKLNLLMKKNDANFGRMSIHLYPICHLCEMGALKWGEENAVISAEKTLII